MQYNIPECLPILSITNTITVQKGERVINPMGYMNSTPASLHIKKPLKVTIKNGMNENEMLDLF